MSGPTLCFAVPGALSIIDGYRPETRCGWWSGETLEQIQVRHPGAVLMTLQAFCEAKAKIQDRPVSWSTVTADSYHDALGCLPPERMLPGAFLVGEPSDHHAITGLPRFACYKRHQGQHWASDRPLTVVEFEAMFQPAATELQP